MPQTQARAATTQVYSIPISSLNSNNDENQNDRSAPGVWNSRVEPPIELIIKPSWRRFYILFLYGLCSMQKSFQWINLSTITNKVAFYYDVDNISVNWTSVLFMLTFIPLVLPTGWLIDQKIGLRKAILIGQAGITIGALIKCFACFRDGFWVILAGQVVVSLSEQFIFCVPSKIAAVWFPDKQITLATGFGIFGNQCGILLGFIIPQWILHELEERDEIGQGLRRLFYGTALVSLVTMVILLFLFHDAPKNAPGAARLKQLQLKLKDKQLNYELRSHGSPSTTSQMSNSHQRRSFGAEMNWLMGILKSLLKQPNCALLMLAYGINVGAGYSIQTLLNQMVAPTPKNIQPDSSVDSSPDANALVGHLGITIILNGMLGALFWGYLCDLTHKYKLITCSLYSGFLLALIGFNEALKLRRDYEPLLYVTASLMGFTMIGYTVAGLDTLVEYSYPIPELISTSLMVIGPQVFGTFLTFVGSTLLDLYGPRASSLFMGLALALGLLVSLLAKETLNRQRVVVASARNPQPASATPNRQSAL